MPQIRSRVWLLVACVFTVALILSAHTWGFRLTFLDDNEIVRGRAEWLAKASSFADSFTHRYFLSDVNLYYRPLVNLSFAVDAHLGGSNPWVYHFTNGVLHASASTLLLLSMLRMGIDPGSALAACALFIVNPMQVASVAWIPGRNDLLLGCFAFGALIFLAQRGQRWWSTLGHGLCFFGALLCKETALCLPAVFALYLGARDGLSKLLRNRGIGLAWGLPVIGYFGLRHRIIEMPSEYAFHLVKSALQHPGVLISDFGKVVLPVHLQVIATARDIDVRLGGVALTVMATVIFLLRRHLRVPAVMLACALVTMPLFMAFLASDFIALENRLYLPIAGMSLLCAECLHAIQPQKRTARIVTLAAGAGVALAFATAAFRYSSQFSDRHRFSAAAIQASPHSYLAIWLNAQPSLHTPSGPARAKKK